MPIWGRTRGHLRRDAERGVAARRDERRVARDARDEEIVRLRRQGRTFAQIASATGVTRQRAQQIVARQAPEPKLRFVLRGPEPKGRHMPSNRVEADPYWSPKRP